MLMDDGVSRSRANRRAAAGLAVILACLAGGCSRSTGGSPGGLLGGLRKNSDSGIRYAAYSKRGGGGIFGDRPKKLDTAPMRVKRY